MPMKQFLGKPFHRPSEDEEKRRQDGRNCEQAPVTQSADDAEHSANPNRRGRRQPGDVAHWVAQDNSGADEADTGQNSLDNASDGVRVCLRKSAWDSGADDRSDCGSHANQGVRAQAGGFAVELAVQSENGTDDERGSESQSRLFIPAQHRTMLC